MTELAFAERVAGWCPLGCGQTLDLVDGQVRCASPRCPRPDAVTTILANPETGHLVTITDWNFTVLHPLRERLDDALLHCTLHAWLAARPRRPAPPGTYRVTLRDGADPSLATWQKVR